MKDYPIVSIEDPLDEEDWEGHAMVTEATGIEIVGDDLFTTNIERVKLGVAAGAANSMVLKITQVGTVTEALDAAQLLPEPRLQRAPLRQSWRPRTIADYAVGLGAGQVRAYDQRRMTAFRGRTGQRRDLAGQGPVQGPQAALSTRISP